MSVFRGRRSVLFNAACNWLGFAAQVVVVFFLSPVLVRALGDDHFGVWTLVESYLAYLTLLDLGVGASVVRFVARFETCQDRDGLNRVYSTSLAIFGAIGLLVLAVVLPLALLFERPLGVPAAMADDVRWLLLLLGINFAYGLPLSVNASVLDGLGRFPTKTAVRTGALLLRCALVLSALPWGVTLPLLAIISTAVNLVDHLAMWVAVRCYLPQMTFAPRLVDRHTLRTIFGYSLNAFWAMLAGRISNQTAPMIIHAFLGPGPITAFAIGSRLVTYAKDSVRSLTTVLTAPFSALQAQGDEQMTRRLVVDATRYVVWLTLPIEVGLLVLGWPFLALWLGAEYAEKCFPCLVILAAPLVLSLSQSVSGRLFYGTGQLGWFARATLIEALVNLGLSVLLVGPLGIEGVAWGTTVPHTLFSLFLAWQTCRALGLGVGDYVRSAFVKPLLLTPGLVLVWWMARQVLPPTGWLSLFAVGGVGLTLYGAAALWLEVGPQRLGALAGRVVGFVLRPRVAGQTV